MKRLATVRSTATLGVRRSSLIATFPTCGLGAGHVMRKKRGSRTTANGSTGQMTPTQSLHERPVRCPRCMGQLLGVVNDSRYLPNRAEDTRKGWGRSDSKCDRTYQGSNAAAFQDERCGTLPRYASADAAEAYRRRENSGEEYGRQTRLPHRRFRRLHQL